MFYKISIITSITAVFFALLVNGSKRYQYSILILQALYFGTSQKINFSFKKTEKRVRCHLFIRQFRDKRTNDLPYVRTLSWNINKVHYLCLVRFR